MLALPPKFMSELEKADRQPFAYLEIEGGGFSDEATTAAHWGAAISESNVDYTAPVPDTGDVVLAAAAGTTTTAAIYATSDITATNFNSPASDLWDVLDNTSDASHVDLTDASQDCYYLGAVTIPTIPDNAHIISVLHEVRGYETGALATVRLGIRIGTAAVNYGPTENMALAPAVTETRTMTVNPDTSAAWTVEEVRNINGIGFHGHTEAFANGYWIFSRIYINYYEFQTSGNITVELNCLGANTANKGIVSIDDVQPSGSNIAYTIAGSVANGGGWSGVALGSCIDGTRVAGYNYYRITATFTGTTTVTPVLKSCGVSVPNEYYKFTTLSDGTLGALPLLEDIPGRNIKLNLKDFVTDTSKMTINLIRNDYTDWMVRNEYFRGLYANIKIGMNYPGIAEGDLVPYYQGRVDTYAVTDGRIAIDLKDATKDLSLKWPVVAAGTSKPLENKDAVHMVQVILDIIDDLSVASRFVDRGTFDTVQTTVGDGTPSSEKYVVSRRAAGNTTITEQKPGKKYVGELCELLGAYLVIQENGRLQLIEYDSSAAAVATWDDNVLHTGGSYSAGLAELRNKVYLYYDYVGTAATGPEGDGINFGSVQVTVDSTSVTNWGITAPKIIECKWLEEATGYYGAVLAAEIATREVTRLKNGVGIMDVTTSLDQAGVQIGDIVTIDSALVINPDVGKGSTRKFLVTAKNWNVGGGKISWTLTEAR